MLSKIRLMVYKIVVRLYPLYLKKVYKMDIGKNVIISQRARIDRGSNPQGIHIGDYTFITGRVLIMAHDHVRAKKYNTYIGKYCFIGAKSIILPGVKINDHVVVAAGSVVTKEVPSNSIVAGNPARVIRTGIKLNKKSQLITNT